jgi:hypothetical protein
MEKYLRCRRMGLMFLIYDADTGAKIKFINHADVGNPDTLVGVWGDHLVVAGDQRIADVKWKNYDPIEFTDKDLPKFFHWWAGVTTTGGQIQGRPFLTADSLFIPTRQRLYRCDVTNGKVAAMYPENGWDEDEGPGNVLVTSDKVIIAGARRVSVYTDLSVATAKLEKEIAAAPNDPDPRIRFAEMLLISGNVPAAQTRLDEAIKLAGPTHRERIFNTAMTFAGKTTFQERNIEFIRGFFDRAAGRGGDAEPAGWVSAGAGGFLQEDIAVAGGSAAVSGDSAG